MNYYNPKYYAFFYPYKVTNGVYVFTSPLASGLG